MKISQADRNIIFEAQLYLIIERRRQRRERKAARVIARDAQRKLWRERDGYT